MTPLPKGETPKKEKPGESKEAAVANAQKENEDGAAVASEPTLTRTNSGKMVDQQTFMAMIKKSAAIFSGASLEVLLRSLYCVVWGA